MRRVTLRWSPMSAGHTLVRFYGERSLMWARESDLEQGSLTERHIADLQTWGRTRQKCGLSTDTVSLVTITVKPLCCGCVVSSMPCTTGAKCRVNFAFLRANRLHMIITASCAGRR